MLKTFFKYSHFFFLIVVVFHNLFPKKIRPIVLLIVSLSFFCVISRILIVCLLVTILSVYLAGIQLDQLSQKKNKLLKTVEKQEKKRIKEIYKRKRRYVLFLCFFVNFSFLFLFKYLNFFIMNINYLIDVLRFEGQFKLVYLIAPIGISFYTLQALSYIFDVYNEKIEADYNLCRLALFISFFPQIIEGPIARYQDIAYDLYEGHTITYENLCFGLQRIAWGLFKKMIIADRMNILVKRVFKNYLVYSGPVCFIGALGYTVMLYMEFSSAMDIVIGIGEILGVKIPENFRQPFFSKNISEFWTRWHISLGTWFKDYVYYPISLCKPMKKLTSKARKKVGNYYGPLISGTVALLAVWLLNGLWHGAGWTFILFGLYHFILIFLGNVYTPFMKRLCKMCHIDREHIAYRTMQSLKMCFFVIIGELIFRAPTVSVAYTMIKKIFTDFHFSVSEIATLGLDIPDFWVMIVAMIIVFIISLLKENNVNIRKEIAYQPLIVRWIIYYVLIFSIVIFGAYGTGYAPVDPIYADF